MKPVKIGELVICGTKFDIEIQEELFREVKLDGCIEYDDSKIKIDKRCVGERRAEILTHEVVHGIDSALLLSGRLPIYIIDSTTAFELLDYMDNFKGNSIFFFSNI